MADLDTRSPDNSGETGVHNNDNLTMINDTSENNNMNVDDYNYGMTTSTSQFSYFAIMMRL